MLKKVFLNKYALFVGIGISLFITGYLKGRASILDKQSNQIVKDVIKSDAIQDKLEVEHDKRIIKILTDPISESDYSYKLSNYPKETVTK